jgi:hypothetical protein
MKDANANAGLPSISWVHGGGASSFDAGLCADARDAAPVPIGVSRSAVAPAVLRPAAGCGGSLFRYSGLLRRCWPSNLWWRCGEGRRRFQRAPVEQGDSEYAQRLISAPNGQDGLYWPATNGERESPLAPLIDQAIDEGYPGEIVSGKPIPYQGYYFRILKGQGENAPGGARDYMVSGKMTGGFALVAWPATYGVSGIMTFLVDQDGVVFQKELGAATSASAGAMTRFDPDVSWAPVDIKD